MEKFGRGARDPTERALRLLSLLQSRRQWPAAELAERFEVTERTIRRDVDRLRELGYLVDATPGRAGGYRLGAGAQLPPLMFDDDEAVALVAGLRTVAGAAIAGIADTAVQALAKVEQSLPDHLRRRVVALDESVTSLQRSHRDSDVVDPPRSVRSPRPAAPGRRSGSTTAAETVSTTNDSWNLTSCSLPVTSGTSSRGISADPIGARSDSTASARSGSQANGSNLARFPGETPRPISRRRLPPSLARSKHWSPWMCHMRRWPRR
jgi:biotin operon repressor